MDLRMRRVENMLDTREVLEDIVDLELDIRYLCGAVRITCWLLALEQQVAGWMTTANHISRGLVAYAGLPRV
jgi:hypothetical protein